MGLRLSEPPHNIEAEESVLGAMLVTEAAVRAVLAGTALRAEHFYRESNGLIFAACNRLAALDEPVDPLTIVAELERTGKLARAGGKPYVQNLPSRVAVAGNARHYAELVTEAAELRAKRVGAQRILAGVDKRDRSEIARGIEEVHTDLRHQAEPVSPMELADEYADALYDDTPAKVFLTPFARLNALAGGGLYPGQVTALLGWSSDGKTTAVDMFAEHFHRAGQSTLILATEMERRERLARYIAGKTAIPFAKLMLRKLSEQERAKALEVLNAIPFSYRRIKGWSVQEIATEIAIRSPDVVVIDSIHGLPYRDASELRQISGELAATASRTGAHMIWVCQLNAFRAKDEKKPEPVLRDIRDSSAIEYDADNVLSLYRDRDNKGDRLETGFLRWLKCRNGLPGPKVAVRLIPGGYGFELLGREEKEKARPAPEQPMMVEPFDP